jgi:hypothetical protein
MYSGKLHAITELGRILIPASELERILRLAQPYDPKPKLTREWKQHTAPSANTGPGCYPTDAVSITEGYADDAAPIAGGYSDDDQSVPANEQDTETV